MNPSTLTEYVERRGGAMETMLPEYFNGTPVYVTPNAVTYEGGRTLELKPWHSRRAYYLRVQKKWWKRFPVTEKPAIFSTVCGFFIHPTLLEKVKAVTADPLSSTKAGEG